MAVGLVAGGGICLGVWAGTATASGPVVGTHECVAVWRPVHAQRPAAGVPAPVWKGARLVLVNSATVSAVLTGAFPTQLSVHLGEVAGGESERLEPASGPLPQFPHLHTEVWLHSVLYGGLPGGAHPTCSARLCLLPGKHASSQEEGRGVLQGQSGGPDPLEELRGRDTPVGASSGWSTWLEAHTCLSVQSLWLRTYHHWISSE